MWLDVLFQECMDAAQSERVSKPVRILCIALISLVFLITIAGLSLLVFVIEGQDLVRRGIFLILWMIAVVSYLQFLHAIVRKGGGSGNATGHRKNKSLFISEAERAKKGIAGFFTRQTATIPSTFLYGLVSRVSLKC